MTKIYYFSATGNSLWSAKKIAEIIEEKDRTQKCELFNIGIEFEKENILIEADAVILVFPSYAYGLPIAVKRFVKKAEFKTPYIASFVTFGSSPLGTHGMLRRILKKKKISKLYFGRIPAVENYLAMFGTPSEEVITTRFAMQREATDDAAQSVIERKENKVNTFTPFSLFITGLFYCGVKIFHRCYQVSKKKCSGCAVCVKLCPVGAISMKKNNRPFFSSKCECCQACVNLCPLRAIQFTRVRYGTPGYRHPEIELKELMR